jgi:putative ABC transport system permease protein
MIRLISAGLLRRRWQSTATILAVGLGVGLLFAAILLQRGLQRGLELGRQRLGADLLVVPARAVVDPDSALFAGSPLNVYMDRNIAEKVKKISGIRRVETQFFTQSLRLECCSVDTEIRLVGIEGGVVSRLAAMSKEGVPSLQPDEVIIGGRLLGGVGKRGTLIELLGGIFKVGFRLEPSATALDYSILMPIDTARKIAGKSEALQFLWKESGAPENLISAILVEVESEARIPEIAEELQGVGPVKIIRAGEIFQRFKKLTDAFVLVLAAAGATTALGGIVYLVSHFAAVAWDRKGEWALYRALGASRPRTVALVVGEAIALSGCGATVGLPLGYGFFRWGLGRLAAQNAFPFVPPTSQFLAVAAGLAMILYVLVGFVSAALPAVKVARLEPALIMAQGDID